MAETSFRGLDCVSLHWRRFSAARPFEVLSEREISVLRSFPAVRCNEGSYYEFSVPWIICVVLFELIVAPLWVSWMYTTHRSIGLRYTDRLRTPRDGARLRMLA